MSDPGHADARHGRIATHSHLAADRCGIPIIFITAYDDKESRRRALQAGAVAFLGKPFSDEQLLQTIRSALRLDEGDIKTAPSNTLLM
jgi:CheY-like chemotaxis protein